MQGEIRVTVIATGFDKLGGTGPNAIPHVEAPVVPMRGAPVIPFPAQRPGARVAGVTAPSPLPPSRVGQTDIPRAPLAAPARQPDRAAQDLNDMEIPTFIRRQMD
jgi:hypothetical protein